jgi:outer membrane lipoprotein-sorting protein
LFAQTQRKLVMGTADFSEDFSMVGRWTATALLLLSGLAIGGVSAQEPKKPPQPNPVAVGSPLTQPVIRSAGATGAELDKKQIEVIQRVNLYFNQIGSLKGTFVQTNADGKRLRGKFYVNRPGRFRFDYARPSMLVIISDGKYVAIQDHDLGTDDRWGLEHTPFQMLLRKDVDLLRDARFFELQDADDAITIALEDKGADSSGRIKIVLSKKPSVELREWIAKDVQGLDTRIVLGDVVKADDLDPALFNPASAALQRQR